MKKRRLNSQRNAHKNSAQNQRAHAGKNQQNPACNQQRAFENTQAAKSITDRTR
jgi:hypothetical protein